MDLIGKKILDRYLSRTIKSRELWEKARTILPDGGGGDMQCYYPYPVYMDHAQGSKLYDVDGNEYVDFFCGAGTVLLGHRSPAVLNAVEGVLKTGIPASVAYRNEVEYAELLRKHMPGMEMIRFLPSGSEANQAGIRVARKFTGRSKVAKFEGGYHGQLSEMLVSIEPIGDACGLEESPNCVSWHNAVPNRMLDSIIVLPFNNIDATINIIEKSAEDLAVVMVEPALVHGGTIPADRAYIQSVMEVCRKNGILVLFDEVITGLRLGLGGAQEVYGVRADMTVLAKPVGGGYPLGVLGGRKDVMQVICMERMQDKVCVAGSTSGHSLGVCAGLAVFKELERGDYYRHVQELTVMAVDGLKDIFKCAGISCRITGDIFGIWRGFWTHFTDRTPRNSRDTYQTDLIKLLNFYIGMIGYGVFMSPTGAPSISAAHTKEDIKLMLEAATQVLSDMKSME